MQPMYQPSILEKLNQRERGEYHLQAIQGLTIVKEELEKNGPSHPLAKTLTFFKFRVKPYKYPMGEEDED